MKTSAQIPNTPGLYLQLDGRWAILVRVGTDLIHHSLSTWFWVDTMAAAKRAAKREGATLIVTR